MTYTRFLYLVFIVFGAGIAIYAQNKGSHLYIKKEYNNDSVLIYEQQLLKTDTSELPHGMLRSYYDNGMLQAESMFDSGYINGTTRVYYRNGQLRQKLHHSYSAAIGPQYAYYENGNPEVFVHFYDPKAITDSTPDYTGVMLHYNRSGEVDSVDGKLLFLIESNNEDSFHVKDSIISDFAFLPPPLGTKAKITVHIKYQKSPPVTDSFEKSESKLPNGYYFLRRMYRCHKEVMKCKAIYELRNLQNRRIMADSVSFVAMTY